MGSSVLMVVSEADPSHLSVDRQSASRDSLPEKGANPDSGRSRGHHGTAGLHPPETIRAALANDRVGAWAVVALEGNGGPHWVEGVEKRVI